MKTPIKPGAGAAYSVLLSLPGGRKEILLVLK
jgi:hypothetical protein